MIAELTQCIPPKATAAASHTLENDKLRVQWDEHGRLVALINKNSGHNYAAARPLWRLYLQRGSELDIEIAATGQAAPDINVDPRENRTSIRYSKLTDPSTSRALAIELHLEASLSPGSEAVDWRIQLSNHEPGIVIRECHFPLVGDLRPTADQQFINTRDGGERIPDLRAELRSRHTLYKAMDHRFRSMVITYPYPAASNCFTFSGQEESLYLGCHAQPIERTLQQFRLYPGDEIEVGFVRFPNLAEGQTYECGPFVTAICAGDWHVAARLYRHWANAWYQPPQAPRWVRRMNGWQRIIMQHQYGGIHYKYPDMPSIHRDGADSGIDTLFMFGWQQGGHDNNYPHYLPDSRLGTEEEMRKGIEHFVQNKGHVILYANGRLIDRNSRFYHDSGHRLAIKDFWGNEIRESYRFSGPGNFTSEFAVRTLVPACWSCPEWYDVLQDLADKTLAWGCHSLFLDQMGFSEYPCNDPTHSHPPLWMEAIRTRAETLKKLRDYLRTANPEVALGIEVLSDITAQYADYVHNLSGGCAAPSGWEKTGRKPEPKAFPDWFRYTFPEVILSDREIRDDTDIERRVNHAVLKGLRSDVEIYRCRKTITETPHYAAYLAKINALRQRHADLLLDGHYIDTDGFTWDNSEIDARAFVATDDSKRMAIILTQSHLDAASTNLWLWTARRNLHFVRHDIIGKGTVQAPSSRREALTITLSRHALLVLLFAPS